MSFDEHPERRSPREIRDDVDEEFRFHLEMRAAELERGGMEPNAARLEAERHFGDLPGARRQCIESDRGRERTLQRREYLHEITQDLTHGVRQLRSRPLFALAAILTLGIGIGATTVIFGAADHILVRAFPYRDVARVMTVWEFDRTANLRKEVSPGNFLSWKERSTSFEAMGLAEPSGFDLTSGAHPEPVAAWQVSEGYFEALGVTPQIGRLFEPSEYLAGGPRVVAISHGLWQRRFGSDPTLVGRTIEVDGVPTTVVAVLPREVEYPDQKDLWAPKAFRPDEPLDHSSSYMRAVARLKPGVTAATARAELDRIAQQLGSEFPRTNATTGIEVVPLEEKVLGPVRPALRVLLGAVVLMLLIACANIAGLLLARGAERERELAIRAALGAGRSRLARQLLTECTLLAGLGGVLGLALAWWGTSALVALGPSWLPRVSTLSVDGRVLAFAVAITITSALLAGFVPALRFSRPEIAGALAGGARSTAGPAWARLRRGLVVTEIALALVLLAGAGLLIRSFIELRSNDVGFVTERRVALQLFLWDRNRTPERIQQRVDQIAERFRDVAGVEAVGVVTALPFHPSQIDAQGRLRVEGRDGATDGKDAQVFTTIASPEYFSVMGIPLQRGRSFEANDRVSGPAVAVVNQALARRCFPGEDPIGKRVSVGVMGAPRTREIVGVVADVRPTALDSDPRPEIFVPFAQEVNGSVTFVVRTHHDPAPLVPRLRAAVWEIDPDQSIYHANTVASMISDTLVERRFILLLLGAFSFIALLLAAIGVYGLISVTTGQRVHEIGVRMALGARPRDIVSMIVSEGLHLIVPGVLLGVGGALLLTRFLERMLYHVRTTDPLTLAQVSTMMAVVALLGALAPAVRGARIDPMEALRQE